MMCEFCVASKPLEDEYDNYEAKIVRLIPLPPINLTTVQRRTNEQVV